MNNEGKRGEKESVSAATIKMKKRTLTVIKM